MARALPTPAYPVGLAFDGVIHGSTLLRRSMHGVALPPVYFGVAGLEDALCQAEGVGVTEVWFLGRVWSRAEGGQWASAMNDVQTAPRQMALEV